MNNSTDSLSHINSKIALLGGSFFWFYVLINMIPGIYFFFTLPFNFIGRLAVLLINLGLFTFLFSLPKNPGRLQIFLLPVLVIHAFQIVLFFLFGSDPIAPDMYLNLVTTNSSEAGELLGAVSISIKTVCFLFIPSVAIAIIQWIRKIHTPNNLRKKFLWIGPALILLSIMLLPVSKSMGTSYSAPNFPDDIYPVNAYYNLGYAIYKDGKIKQYLKTSKGFSFDAKRVLQPDQRQIFVLVVGETSRAPEWHFYGYPRNTNPKLAEEPGLIVFKDALTQSNVTHKSVPIILSSNNAENFKDIYHRKGIFEAFKETGFTTVCLSNQANNHSFIEFFTNEADEHITIRVKKPNSDEMENHYDTDLIPLLKKAIEEHQGNLFIVLHSYGSHFNYNDRYPHDYSVFQPDKIGGINKEERPELVNAYDNSILFTDNFLSRVINVLKDTHSASFMVYLADHGEDIFDDSRDKFLHASPTPTYYQLRVPFFIWASPEYDREYPEKIREARMNTTKGISSNTVFHTLLDAAGIRSPYLKENLSLVNRHFKGGPRMFLNDYDEAVPYLNLHLDEEDRVLFKKNKIQP